MNGEITFENFQDILNIFSDFNLIHMRRSPLSRLAFKYLDKNMNNKINAQDAVNFMCAVVEMDQNSQVNQSFVWISNGRGDLSKEDFLKYMTLCL